MKECPGNLHILSLKKFKMKKRTNKFNILIDGNHFLHTTLGICGLFNGNLFHIDSDEAQLKKDSNFLFERMSTIFASDVRNFQDITKSIFWMVDESRSWRKEIILDNNYKGLPNSLDYKGNREKSNNINWGRIYKTFREFTESLQTFNCYYYSITGCEADDVIFMFSCLFNAQGENVIVYSGDNDLKQCIGFDKSHESFTLIYQKQQKNIGMDLQTARYLKAATNLEVIQFVKRFTNNTKCTLSVVDVNNVILEKVLVGDSGDNVFSVMVEMAKYKSGSKIGEEYERRITPTIVEKIKKEIGEFSPESFFDQEFITLLANSCIRNFKTITKFDIDNVINNINLNVQLVLLHKQSYPIALSNSMIDNFNLIEDAKYASISKLGFKDNILKEIKSYEKTKEESASSASIFKHFGL